MFLIRSGIPAFDDMFHPGPRQKDDESWSEDQFGIFLRTVDRTTSICIAGPDGTGKSVLAMHFASRYLADCHQYCRISRVSPPHALYISSDLSYLKAMAMWTNFALDAPNRRRVPFKYPQIQHASPPHWLSGRSYDVNLNLDLVSYAPDRLEPLGRYLGSARPEPEIAFLDLASHTAGDEWSFIERLIAVMPNPADRRRSQDVPRHLVVIDAMEGMETFGGEVDSFGEETTRRGRVAKLMRLAAAKCHLVLVVEEPSEGERLAEQFVADVVLRLRATETHGYTRRTVEIEKARGQSHVRGRHPYVVRDGRGSTTGEQVNFDDPRVEEERKSQSYVDVFPSLHSISRAIMENRAPGPDRPSARRAGFGIRALDELLAKAPPSNQTRQRGRPTETHANGHDPQGLPSGSVTALIGDANTQKSNLGYAFLGHVFHDLAWNLVCQNVADNETALEASGWSHANCAEGKDGGRAHYVKQLCASFNAASRRAPIAPRRISKRVRRWAYRIEQLGRGIAGAVVLVTTKDENNRTLVERFCRQLQCETEEIARYQTDAVYARVQRTWEDASFRHALAAYLETRTICRRLEIHDTPSAVLYHVIRRSIEAAQQVIDQDHADPCFGRPLPADADIRAESGWKIRFVLDDFNSVMLTYGRIHEDPLFLPFLLLNLRREGLSSLIVDTQVGAHGLPAMVLGANTQSDLRTLSDHRIYTWHIPEFFGDHRIAIAAIPPMVRQEPKSPVLVRELEWYEPNSQLPPTVNPRFELYAGLDTGKPTRVPLRVHLYAETPAWESYISSLDDLWRRVFEPVQSQRDSTKVVIGESARNYDLMRQVCGLHQDTNLVYSSIVQIDEFWEHAEAFRSQSDYLARWPDEPGEKGEGRRVQRVKRKDWFDRLGYAGFGEDEDEAALRDLDRVPFVWDFGFLACRERLWIEAIDEGATQGKKRETASKVWKRMTEGAENLTWRELLEAAAYVAEWESRRLATPVPAFDLAMVAPQTFSCLVLEIWFSEIYKNHPEMQKELGDLMRRRGGAVSGNTFTLAALVRKFEPELYCTWLLLAESLDLGGFGERKEGFGFGFGRKEDTNAVVTRHWYKTAALAVSGEEKAGPVRFCRLPGAFSVRGDWFLATMRGSRSDRLADRALDLLATPEANVDRLMRGIGLPTRKLKLENLSTHLRGTHFKRHDARRNDALEKEKQLATATLTYDDVMSLGVTPRLKRFHWLWRSNLTDYALATPVWERWLYRILRRWKRTREHFASDWFNGFELYDIVTNELQERGSKCTLRELAKTSKRIPDQVVSVEDFPKQCRNLTAELDQLNR